MIEASLCLMNLVSPKSTFWILRLRLVHASLNFRRISNLLTATDLSPQIAATIDPGSIQFHAASFCNYAGTILRLLKYTPQLSDRSFIEKGFDSVAVDLEFKNTLKVDRHSLLVEKSQCEMDDSFKWPILTSFSVQHRD